MSRIEIRELTDDHLDDAAALLAARHRVHRTSQPGLDPAYERHEAARRELAALWEHESASTGTWGNHVFPHACLDGKVPRIALFTGSRVANVLLPDDAVLLEAPPPLEPLSDVSTAVTDALRYPLVGPPLEELVTRHGRVTIVVEPPLLPLPGAPDDPRREALAAVLDELHRLGVPRERQTVLLAGGLERRAGRSELEALLRPDRAHDFRGTIVVHDCESKDLLQLGDGERVAFRVHPSLLETDLVVTVTAAETVSHGGPSALLRACSAGALRAATAESLLEPSTAPGWELGTRLETLLGERVPQLGVSLVLDLPRTLGRYSGYPWSSDAREALTRSVLRAALNAAPAALRRRALDGIPRQLRVAAVLAGKPSVAHSEALLRGIALRGIALGAPLDTIVVPIPWQSPHQPREALNPVTVAATGLGLALRLWRDQHPLREGGTVVLLHGLSRTIGHGPQAPFGALFAALRDGPAGARLREAEAVATRDRRALSAYRTGGAPHPRLPFADWEDTAPVRARAGRVIVAGCRDAGAARALGFVPSHNIATALDMAQGLAGPRGRMGVLLAPPYAPLVVGS